MSEPSTLVIAFNQGCQARINGQSVHGNPYSSVSTAEWKYWTYGWHDVNRWWGALARWPVPKLPPVRER